MLRLCRSSLCLEVIDFEGCVAPSGLHVQYLDSAISAGVDAVPLAKCFDNRQYLTEQAQRQFQALLVQLAPCKLLDAASAEVTALHETAAAPASNTLAKPTSDSPAQQQIPLPSSNPDSLARDVTQDSQDAAAAVQANTHCHGSVPVGQPVSPAMPAGHTTEQHVPVRTAQATSLATPPTAKLAAVGPSQPPIAVSATIWPSMIPETCLEFSNPALDPAMESPAKGPPAAVLETAGQAEHSMVDLHSADLPAQPKQHHHHHHQQKAGPEFVDRDCMIENPLLEHQAPHLDVEQGDYQQQQSWQMQQEQQLQQHLRISSKARLAPLQQAATPAAPRASGLQSILVPAVGSTAVSAPVHHKESTSSSKHTAPALQLQPVKPATAVSIPPSSSTSSATATAAASSFVDTHHQQQQQQEPKQQLQQREPLGVSHLINAGQPSHDTAGVAAVGGTKVKSKLTVMDQLAALPARKVHTKPAMSSARTMVDTAVTATAPAQHHEPQAQQYQQQYGLQHHHQQHMPVWQQPQPLLQQQQQQQQQFKQHTFSAHRAPGLRPPPPPALLQQQAPHQQQQRPPAVTTVPRGPTAAAQAYRKKTTFKAPRPIKPTAAVATAASMQGHQQSYDKGLIKAAAAEQDSDPSYRFLIAAAEDASAANMFVTGAGQRLKVSEQAKTKAAEIEKVFAAEFDNEEDMSAATEMAQEPQTYAEFVDDRQYAGLDAAVQAACARFEAQMTTGAADAFGFVNLRGAVQLSAAAAAASARYMQFMNEEEKRLAAAAADNDDGGSDVHVGPVGHSAAAADTTQRQATGILDAAASVAASSSGAQGQQILRVGGGSGAFKLPRRVVQQPATAVPPPQLTHQQDQHQFAAQQQQQTVLGHYKVPLGHRVQPWDTAAPAAAAAGSNDTQGFGSGGSSGNADELASLERLMEAADRYAAENAAARAARSAELMVAAAAIPAPAADGCIGPCEGHMEPDIEQAEKAAAAAAAAAAVSTVLEAVEVQPPEVTTATETLIPADAVVADLDDDTNAITSDKTSSCCTAASGSTSCAGGSTLERQISDASGGLISETLLPEDQQQQQQHGMLDQQQQQQQLELVSMDGDEGLEARTDAVAVDIRASEPEDRIDTMPMTQQHQQQHPEVQESLSTLQKQNKTAAAAAQGRVNQQPAVSAPTAKVNPGRKMRLMRAMHGATYAAAPTTAVLSPFPGLVWASGDGLLLSKSAAARGQAFVERLQYMGLLPATGSSSRVAAAASASCDQDMTLVVDLLVTADGLVELLLLSSNAEVVSVAAMTGAAAAAMQEGHRCLTSKSNSKRHHDDVTRITTTAATAGRVDQIGRQQCQAPAEAEAEADASYVRSPPTKRQSTTRTEGLGLQSSPTADGAAVIDVAAVGQDHGRSVIAETPVAAAVAVPTSSPSTAAVAAVVAVPSPSPARGRKLSFSAAAFTTPLPIDKRQPAATGGAVSLPKSMPSTLAAAGTSTPEAGSNTAKTPLPPPPAAAAGLERVVPATPLTEDKQQEQQQLLYEAGVECNIRCSQGDVHLANLDCMMVDATLALDEQQDQEQQQQPGVNLMDNAAVGAGVSDTLALDCCDTYVPDTMQLDVQDSQQHLQQHQQQGQGPPGPLDDTLTVEQSPPGVGLSGSQRQQRQHEQQIELPSSLVGDTLPVDDMVIINLQQQQQEPSMKAVVTAGMKRRHDEDTAGAAACPEAPQQQQQQEAADGSDTQRPSKRRSVTPDEVPANTEQQQKQVTAAVPIFAGLSTGSGMKVTIDPQAVAAFKQRMGDFATYSTAQQQQAGTTAAAAAAPAVFAGLSTGSGKKVSVNAQAVAAFKQRMGDLVVDSSAQQQPVAAAAAAPVFAGLSTGSGKTVVVDPQAVAAFKQRMGDAVVDSTAQQQQEQQVAVAPAVASTVAGLSTGSGKKVTVDPQAVANFKQRMGDLAVAGTAQQQHRMAAAAPPTFAGLSTGSGKVVNVHPDAVAAFKQRLGDLQPDVPQNQQAISCTAAAAAATPVNALLSTAGGRKVDVNPAAVAAFKQMFSDILQPQQQQQGEDVLAVDSVDKHEQQPQGAAAAITERETAAVMCSEGARKPPLQPSRADHATYPPSAAAAGAPISAPRIMSRKRQMGTPVPQQQQRQQQQRTGSKKAFKLPVRAGTKAVDTAAAATAAAAATRKAVAVGLVTTEEQTINPAATAGNGQEQKQQKLPIAEYFALARDKLPATATGQVADIAAIPAAAAADAASEQRWFATSLPVTPEQAAVFTFASTGAVDTTQQQQSGCSVVPSSSMHTAAPTTAAAATAAVFGPHEARQQLLSWGADPQKATTAWFANHYKWVVWKLASYDRKLLGDSSSSVKAADNAAALQHVGARCLTVANVQQQLQHRYTAEMVEGRRSVLRKILEQDLPAGVPIVLMVSAIRTSCSSKKGKQQQQQQDSAGSSASGTAAAAAVAQDVDVLGVQLSDGWYHINAMLDAPLVDLVVRGRIQVGVKLRVVGADLRSDRPADPLEAAQWAMLRICYNGVSPADWDAKLGAIPAGQTLRALAAVHPAGGVVPRLLLLVERCYPLLYYCRNSRKYYTRKQQQAAQRQADRQQEQAMQAAAAAVQTAEMQQCQQWLSSRTATAVQRTYAAAVLGSSSDGHGDNSVTPGQLQLLRSQRENQMEQQRQQHMQQLMLQGNSTNPAAGSNNNNSSSSRWSLEPPVPVQRFRVSGVVPKGFGPKWGFGQAVIRVWRAHDAMQGLDEGSVVLATGLQAGTDGRSSYCDIEWQGNGRMLELASGKNTSWEVLGPAPSPALASQYDMLPWTSRQKVKLSCLTQADLKTEFDFVGVLLFAGEVVTGHRGCHQWVFLAGDDDPNVSAAPAAEATAASGRGCNDLVSCGQQQQQQQQTAGGHMTASIAPHQSAQLSNRQPTVVLAVKLMGAETAVDWMIPTKSLSCSSGSRTDILAADRQQQQQQTPGAAAGNSDSNRSNTAATRRIVSRRLQTPKQQQQQQVKDSIVSCSNLVLSYRDVNNGMWVATAGDTAAVTVLTGAAVGSRADRSVQEVITWAREQQQLVMQLKQQVMQLVQG